METVSAECDNLWKSNKTIVCVIWVFKWSWHFQVQFNTVMVLVKTQACCYINFKDLALKKAGVRLVVAQEVKHDSTLFSLSGWFSTIAVLQNH